MMWWRREVQTYSDSTPEPVWVTLQEIREGVRRIEANLNALSARLDVVEARLDALEARYGSPAPRALAEYGPGSGRGGYV